MQYWAGTPLQRRILLEAVRKLKEDGYGEIKVDHIFWDDGIPQEIEGKIPDISGEKYGKTRLVEVETEDSYQYDREHLRELCEYASSLENFEFFVAVPKEIEDKIRDVMEIDWDIHPDGWYAV